MAAGVVTHPGSRYLPYLHNTGNKERERPVFRRRSSSGRDYRGDKIEYGAMTKRG